MSLQSRFLVGMITLFGYTFGCGQELKRDKRFLIDELGITINTGLPYLLEIDADYALRVRTLNFYPSIAVELASSLFFGSATFLGGINYSRTETTYKLQAGTGIIESGFGGPSESWVKAVIQGGKEKYFSGSNYFGYRLGAGMEYWVRVNYDHEVNYDFYRAFVPRGSIGVFMKLL